MHRTVADDERALGHPPGEEGWSAEEGPEDELTATLNAIQSLKLAAEKELAPHFGVTEGGQCPGGEHVSFDAEAYYDEEREY